METQTADIDVIRTGTHILPPDLFVRQVADVALPASQVLLEQRREPRPEPPAPLFVP